jgi:uncharacterized protein (TIGR03084 family)
MPIRMSDLAADLAAESADIDALVDPLPEPDWEIPTPAAGWLIRDQISHLAYFDGTTVQSIVDPEGFQVHMREMLVWGFEFPDRVALEHRAVPAAELRAWWRRARQNLVDCAKDRDPGERVPWYGPSMSLASSITARIMETWAHGQDIADALGVSRRPTERLRHIAHLGIGARAFSYQANKLEIPDAPIRVELLAPDGTQWTWGPAEAADLVAGDALDFCLLVTQRRHRDEVALRIVGDAASSWMRIAQAFAGAAGPGRPAPVSDRL